MAARILVVEDNPANLELMVYLLQAFGHSTITAHDGEEGSAAAQQELPDLIVCDLHLPKLDGFAMARQLKAHRRLSHIPLVAVTALAMVGDREKALTAGFDGYIAKPIDPEIFVRQVEGYMPPSLRSTPPQRDNEAAPSTINSPRPENKGTILIVDNSLVNRQVICSTLAPSGYALMLADNAQEGLALAQQQAPDLIISDIHMPGSSGVEFLEQVRKDRALHDLPFILMTASLWNESDRHRAAALMVDGFITRPIEPRDLLREVEACLQSREDKLGTVPVVSGKKD